MKDFGNSTVIYTKTTCGHCIQAKQLLRDRGITFTEIVIDGVTNTKDTMSADLGREVGTVPQIILKGTFIPGGCAGLKQHFGV